MLLKELARTSVFLPEIGIGLYGYRAGPQVLRQGLEAGALFLDTAESYGTEEVAGAAVRGMRERVFVATKVSPQNFRDAAFRQSVDASLKRLQIETIDLLQLHHPNPAVPIAETLGAATDLVRAGKVRYLGVSNFTVAQLREAQAVAGPNGLVSNQVRYSLIDRTIEAELLPYCQANGIMVIAYTPLGREWVRIQDCDPNGILDQIARETGRTPAQIVLNWCIWKDRVVAIPMSNSAAHLVENCGASDWRLTADQLALLDSQIQFRHRGRFDRMVRTYTPAGLQPLAKRALKWLPRDLRRRFT